MGKKQKLSMQSRRQQSMLSAQTSFCCPQSLLHSRSTTSRSISMPPYFAVLAVHSEHMLCPSQRKTQSGYG